MDIDRAAAAIVAPEKWVLVFKRKAEVPWINRLVPGRHKHVAAYTYVVETHTWLIYEVHLGGTSIIVAADDDAALRFLDLFTADADLVLMRRAAPFRAARLAGRLGFYCVPAIKHLIGLSSGALLPSGLYRDCVAAGGQIIAISPAVPAAAA